jgi:hypothetical protein
VLKSGRSRGSDDSIATFGALAARIGDDERRGVWANGLETRPRRAGRVGMDAMVGGRGMCDEIADESRRVP